MPEPGDHEVLIKVKAASVNRSDWETLTGRPLYARVAGLRRPRRPILGSDVAGVVEKVGTNVTEFVPGDRVFGDILNHGAAAFAEYVCVPQAAPIVAIPASLTDIDASTLPQAGIIALQGLATVESGHKVLINGSGGGTGVFAIQLAVDAGANVTGVDNGLKQDLMRSFGAHNTIDYTTTDYTKTGDQYDLILDMQCERSMFAIRRAVGPGGRYRVVGGSVRSLIAATTVGQLLRGGGRRFGVLMARPNKEDLRRLAEMVVAGDLITSVEHTYRLEEVPDALRHLGEGSALGKLVIEVG